MEISLQGNKHRLNEPFFSGQKNCLLVGGVPRIKVYHSKERITCISREGQIYDKEKRKQKQEDKQKYLSGN